MDPAASATKLGDGLKGMHPAQRAKMERIASQEGNQVLQWEWDQLDEVKSTDYVKATFDEISEKFMDLLAQLGKKERKAITQNEVRKRIIAMNPGKYSSFSKTHPRFFEEAIKMPPFMPDDDHQTGGEEAKKAYEKAIEEYRKSRTMVVFLLNMNARVESGELTRIQASQIVQRFTMQLCNTGETYEQYQARTQPQQQQVEQKKINKEPPLY